MSGVEDMRVFSHLPISGPLCADIKTVYLLGFMRSVVGSKWLLDLKQDLLLCKYRGT